MIDDQQTHRLPAEPEALDAVAAARRPRRRRGADRIASRRTSSASAPCSTGWRRSAAETLSNDPDILRRRTRTLGFARGRDSRCARIADWRSGQARSLRSPAARTAFEAMLPGAAARDRRRPRPEPCAQPLQRHRRAGVERGQSLPPARGAAAAGRSCSPDPRPCAGARRPAGAPAGAARRPDRRIQLRAAARAAATWPSASTGDARASPTTRRSTACGGWSTSAASRSASS